MNLPELAGDLPPRQIPETDYQRFQRPLSQFASAVYCELLEKASNKPPKDILMVGDNWLQLVNIKEAPPKFAFLLTGQKLPGGISFGSPFRCDAWQIMPRFAFKDLGYILAQLSEGVRAGSLDPRILRELLLLDLTQERPILTETDLSQTEETPWGTNGLFRGTGLLLWHIRDGYHRQQSFTDPQYPDLEASFYTPESVDGLDPDIWE